MKMKNTLQSVLPALWLALITLLLAPSLRAQSPVALESAFPALSFASPLFITAAPGDDRHLYVVTQAGRIYVFDNDPAVTTAEVFLDISSRVNQNGGELGLLGLAFAPDFAQTGHFFVNYNPSQGTRRTSISRFTATSATRAQPESELILLQYDQPYPNHNGGWLGFGPDGKLYITAGDGGAAGDPQQNAQSLGSPLGKILRINGDGSIPADNPFVGVEGARGEIWAYGLRNPFRASFDRATGALWAADVGQNEWEEVDLIERGGNYGWPYYEASTVYDASTPQPQNPLFPVTEYRHDEGRCSIQGGYVYRGAALPAVQGAYFYADYCSSDLWMLTGDAENGYLSTLLLQVPGNPTSFGEDSAGELYITSYDGHIYRLVAATGEPDAPPALLSATGLFADTAGLVPAENLIPYQVNAPFWSDGAIKTRWLALPAGETVDFSAEDAWTFPIGSRFVKHFELDLASGERIRVETRVLERQALNWRGYTYRWREDQLDAELSTETAFTHFSVVDANGSVVDQLYEFPSSSACMSCHTSSAGYALGVTTDQLNGPGSGRVSDDVDHGVNQLRYLQAQGVFSSRIGNPRQYDALPDPFDAAAASLNQRARSYLQTNCAQCHRPGGPTPVDMDLRYDTPLSQTQTVNVAGTDSDLAPYRIAPGAKEQSLIWVRMAALDDNRMPPVGSHVVDQQGLQLIGEWIDSYFIDRDRR